MLTSRAGVKRSAARGGVVRPMAVSGELAQVAELASASSVLTLGGVVGGLAAISKLSSMRIDSRVDEAIAKAESYGIDLTDLYYDFDVPVGGEGGGRGLVDARPPLLQKKCAHPFSRHN